MVERTPTQETTVRATTSLDPVQTVDDAVPTAGAATGTIADPPPRDLTVDALRALAIVAVAVGHWLVVVPTFTGGHFDGSNALETVPLMRALSWVFQVMPLFFVLGGYANAHSWRSAQRKGQPYHGWLRTRLVRLLRPSAVFVAVWVAVSVLLRGLGTDPELVRLMAWLAVVPVWFLAVYVVVVAVAPAMLALHDRFGLVVPIVLAALATAVDAVRLGTEVAGVEWTNFFWVFLFAQQLGFFWVDGAFTRRRWTPVALVAGGLGALVLLTLVGPYPVSLVGVPGEAIANNAPPTITLIALGLAQTGLAVLARDRIARLLQRPAALRPVVVLNQHAMTMLLWHFTALILVAVVVLPLGVVPTYPSGSLAWWCTRIAAVLVLCGPLAALVSVFGRFERGGAPAGPARPTRPDAVVTVAMLAGVVLSALAFALVATGGLSTGRGWWGVPMVPVALLVGAAALTRVGADPA